MLDPFGNASASRVLLAQRIRFRLLTVFFCVFVASTPQCFAKTAREVFNYLVAHSASPRNSIAYLRDVPPDLRRLSAFAESLTHPEQSRLILLAREAANGYAKANSGNPAIKQRWSLNEANYCELWLTWYSDKRGRFHESVEVKSYMMEENRVVVIGFLGEALYEAGDVARVCQHFADYSNDPSIDESWLETWANALFGKRGSPWNISAVARTIRESFDLAAGRDEKKSVLKRFEQLQLGIDNFRKRPSATGRERLSQLSEAIKARVPIMRASLDKKPSKPILTLSLPKAGENR